MGTLWLALVARGGRMPLWLSLMRCSSRELVGSSQILLLLSLRLAVVVRGEERRS
jgi:hypothetical protein